MGFSNHLAPMHPRQRVPVGRDEMLFCRLGLLLGHLEALQQPGNVQTRLGWRRELGLGEQGLETMGGGAVGLNLLEGVAELGQEAVPLITWQQGVALGKPFGFRPRWW